jgi:hypothetical protein
MRPPTGTTGSVLEIRILHIQPLNGYVFYSEVFQQMLRVEGGDRVEELRLIVDGERMGRCENAVIARDDLAYPTNHELNVLLGT